MNKERYANDPDYRARENARSRAYHHAHKHEINPRRRGAHFQSRYGISRADYDALLKRQGGVCAICAKPSKRTLCVDHCHVIGTIRGLLCHNCNTALGYLKDDQASLLAALAYLGARDADVFGSAAQRARLTRAALPGPARRAVLTEVRVPPRSDAALRARHRREDVA